MANTKVSQLPPVAALLAADEFPVNESGVSKKVTAAQLQTFVAAALAGLTSVNPPAAFGGETFLFGRPGIDTVGLTPVAQFYASKSGGTNLSIPAGLVGHARVTGGLFDHAIGLLGYADVKAGDVAGQYIGIEGRWDNPIDGAFSMKGLLGLGVIQSTTAVGLTGGYAAENRIEVPITAAALHIGIANWLHIEATGSGDVTNGLWWNAILGSSSTTAPATAKTTFRGRVQSNDGDLNVTIEDNATQNLRRALLAVGTNLMSVAVKLGTTANTSLFSVLDSGGATLFSVDGGKLVNFGIATTALGGGAAPTLGTIGGSGPAAAAQNAWLKVQVAGVNKFIPIWA